MKMAKRMQCITLPWEENDILVAARFCIIADKERKVMIRLSR